MQWTFSRPLIPASIGPEDTEMHGIVKDSLAIISQLTI